MGRLNVSVGGGGGVSSDEVTAALSDVLEGKTALTSDSNDEIGAGTMVDKSGTEQNAEASLDAANSRLLLTVPKTGKYSTKSKLYAAYSIIRSLIGLTEAKIATGSTILGISGNYKGLGDATVDDVLSGKTFSTESLSNATGTIPNNGAVTKSLDAGGSYTIPKGYHNGSGKVTANSLASQTSGTAEVAEIISGNTAWVNGKKITGTMTNNGAVSKTFTPGASSQSYAIPAGYHNGSGKVTCNAVTNLLAKNIALGKTVGGVEGTYEGFAYIPDPSYLVYKGNNTGGFTLNDSLLGLTNNGTLYSGFGEFLLWDAADGVVRSYGSKQKSYNLSNYSKIRFMIRGVYSPAGNPSITINSYFGSDYSKSYETRLFGNGKILNFSNYHGEAYDIDISSITGTKYIAFNFLTPTLTIFSIKSIQLIA